YVDVVGMTSGVLNFAPAEADLAIDSEEKRLLALVFSWLGNIFGYQILGAIKQHAGRFVVVLSFKISPPKGFGVLLSILAMFSAALFAIAACPSARVRKTGFLGAILSRSSRDGNCGGSQNVSIQPRPVIHLPRSVFATPAF